MDDVHGLRVFVAVAQNLSFTRAAETLFLTQSAVSHQIARLERELGASLFERLGRRVELTAAGDALVAHARRVFATLDEAAAAVKQAGRPGTGALRIGASATACQFLIPAALREFRECYPGYALAILPGDSPAVVERLLEGTIDLGIVIRQPRQPKLQLHPLFADELGIVVSGLHPMAKLARARRADIEAEKFVLYSRASSTWRLLERYFGKIQVTMRDPIELGSIEAIKELVKLGLGITVLAKWVCQRELNDGSLAWLGLPGTRIARHWCVAAPASRTLSIPERTFTGLCRAAAKQLGD